MCGLAVLTAHGTAAAEPGEGLRDLRTYTEEAIAAEETQGHTELAGAMRELLPEMLREEARSHQDGGEEVLAAHDPGIRRGLLDLADHMDARLGGSDNSHSQGGSFTLFVRSDGVTLTLTPSQSVNLVTENTTVTVNPGSGPAEVISPGSSNNSTVGFSSSPGNSGGGGGPPEGRGKNK